MPFQISDPKVLYEILRNFGQIEFVVIMANHNKAFVQCKTIEDAGDIFRVMQRQKIFDKILEFNFSKF